MIHSLAEAEPCPPPVVLSDDRHAATLEIHALTAAIVSLRRHDGHHHARLNAFVDGVGHRTVHVELTPLEYAHAASTLQSPGTLVRCSGVLRPEGSALRLLRPHGLQILVPTLDHAG